MFCQEIEIGLLGRLVLEPWMLPAGTSASSSVISSTANNSLSRMGRYGWTVVQLLRGLYWIRIVSPVDTKYFESTLIRCLTSAFAQAYPKTVDSLFDKHWCVIFL